MRSFPNILITGTPGVGKTTTCSALVASASASAAVRLRYLSLNALAKEHDCYSGWDEDLQTHVLDEDKVLDEVERVMGTRGESNKDRVGEEEEEEEVGGWVLDYHSAELFPRAWVDLVVVLRCEATDVLWDRLTARGYSEKKVQENLDAEIFGVLAEEAREAFDEEGMVVELKSESSEDVDENVERILEWAQRWGAGMKSKEIETKGS